MKLTQLVNMTIMAMNYCATGYPYQYETFHPVNSTRRVHISTKIQNTFIYAYNNAPRELPFCLEGSYNSSDVFVTDGVIPPIISATDSTANYDAAMVNFKRTHPQRQGLTPSYVTERLIEYMQREFNYRRK